MAGEIVRIQTPSIFECFSVTPLLSEEQTVIQDKHQAAVTSNQSDFNQQVTGITITLFFLRFHKPQLCV